MIDPTPADRRRLLRRVGRTATWPARRFLDPRFELGRAQVAEVEARLTARIEGFMAGAAETTAHVGSQLRAVESQLDRMRAELSLLSKDLNVLALESQAPDAVDAPVAALTTRIANLLNYAEGHEGYAAQSELWFNPPLSLHYEEGEVTLGGVNERVAEVPYVFGALGGLAAGARVLDVGCAESTVAFSLASLGLEVTALDPRGYPLSHPRVRAVSAALEEWDSGSEMFDAVLFLSSVEHFGLQGYSEGEVRSDADVRALERARSLLRPDGLLVLTVPFGLASVDGFQRVYDREGLDTLLAGWSVDDLVVIRRGDGAYWERVEEPVNVDPDRRYAALIRATPLPE